MATTDEKLDNPVWYSLGETHEPYSLSFGTNRFYRTDYCPFGSIKAGQDTAAGLGDYSKLCKVFYMVGDRPEHMDQPNLHKNLICDQMVLQRSIPTANFEQIVELTEEEQKKELYHLVNYVQPGYFMEKTPELGRYFGIYKAKKLIAVAGERMKMEGYTEISAVVTHPSHTGRGYAKQLVKHTAEMILNDDRIPYLHVAETNTVAIKLYEKLGFERRRKMNFWQYIVQ